MDTTDENIVFDEKGVCNRCNEYKNRILPEWKHGSGHEGELQNLLERIKKSGKNKKYDCILGLSGGIDSTYMLHLAVKEWGLRPFVFHIDAGWNLPVAEENISKVTKKLNVELHVEKMDWREMREMQLAWFRTGLEMLDAPQDHAFIAIVDKYAQKLGVKYILNGFNILTEVVADPSSWTKHSGPTGDGKFMKDVIRKYCRIPIRKYSFTNGFKHKFWIPYVLKTKTVKPLNLVPFSYSEMVSTLEKEYGYTVYSQKHFEDLLTKFLEGYWQPVRFGHDIRIVHLSSLIITGQMTREEAVKVLDNPPLSENESKELFSAVASKLEIDENELRDFLYLPECKDKFKSNEKAYKLGIKLFEKLGLENRIRK